MSLAVATSAALGHLLTLRAVYDAAICWVFQTLIAVISNINMSLTVATSVH